MKKEIENVLEKGALICITVKWTFIWVNTSYQETLYDAAQKWHDSWSQSNLKGRFWEFRIKQHHTSKNIQIFIAFH